MPGDTGLDGECVGLKVIALGEALLSCVVGLPTEQMHTAAGGGEHLLPDLVGAEAASAQGGDIVAQVLHQGAATVLSAMAFVHLGEEPDHVADGSDFGHADGLTGSGGGCAVGDLSDVRQGQAGGSDRVGGGAEETAPVQFVAPHR
ncbi:hypothetical protein [Streptomyces malaysiensis]|uniref:hypothetical protein n=1 Tax=Streptomyces malaysiensis TaxID=92644 RepID=UPI001E5F7C25|nr:MULTISPECIES: hypothetical protein [unclassified Streptomyces]